VYQYALQAGVRRIDLRGQEVGTVTEQEHRAAQKQIKEDMQRLSERKSDAVIANTKLYRAGRVPYDQLKKLDAPPMSASSKVPAINVAPELTRLYEAFVAANTTLTGASDAGLRLAMTSAALGVVIKEAQRVIDSPIN
jgi:sRNA-binding protein